MKDSNQPESNRSKHKPELYRRSLSCAIQHLSNAVSNLPDGQGLDSIAVEELPTVINSLQQLWLMSALRQGIDKHPPGPSMEEWAKR